MKVVFITVGAIKKGHFKEGFNDYTGRIGRYCPVEVVEVRDEARRGRSSLGAGEGFLRKEADRILGKLVRGDHCVVLSEKATKTFTSKEFARFVQGRAEGGTKRLCFIVGGPYGLHSDIMERANTMMSLSPMTLPHEMAALVLAEQVYRAFTIIRGEPYSH